MNLQPTGRLGARNPAKSHQKASQIVPSKLLGWLAQRGRSGPVCPQFAKSPKFPFAPGVVDMGDKPSSALRWLIQILGYGCAVAMLVAVICFAAGYGL